MEFSISKEEIELYLKETLDGNPIHRGASPIVPGLCLLNRIILLQHWDFRGSEREKRFEIRFLKPVFAGEQVTLIRKSSFEYTACVLLTPVLTITIEE